MTVSRSGVASVLRRIYLFGLFLCAWPSLVSAADEPVVLIGVFRDNRQDGVLQSRLRDHLARNGELIANVSDLRLFLGSGALTGQ